MATELMWFRRDLRIHDNPALVEAVAAEALATVFVLDPVILGGPRMAPARLRYLRDALADLRASIGDLGGRLIVLRGDPRAVLPTLAADLGATVVHVCADHTPFAVRRDDEVDEALAEREVELQRHDGVAILRPGSVRTGSDSVYKVFTPFHRSWRDTHHGDPLPPPTALPPVPVDAPEGLPQDGWADLDVDGPEEPWPSGGEGPARARLDAWLDDGVEGYADTRNRVDLHGTSRLSADLHLGCLSARETWSRLDRRRSGHETFAAELVWRDFYLHVMAEWPHAATSAFREDLSDLPWPGGDEAFDAWAGARTGYPIVDAAMRQLHTTGWMHNRARMIVASFLTKDLLVDWRRGEAHFLAHLVDGDVSSNNGGWQWAAGTGTDAQPFFRIFNPVSQGQRFDPEGVYVRRFLPELDAVPTRAIHQPWTMSDEDQEACGVVIGVDYPAPVVDHAEARLRALAWWEAHT